MTRPGKPARKALTRLSLLLGTIALAGGLIAFPTRAAGLTLEEIWIRDPNILFHDGAYYMTGTTAGDGFLGYSSTDLATWTPLGHIYTRNASNTWAQFNFWAPEQVYKDGKFYLFFSGKTDTTNRATGVAVATSPAGPYVDLMANPLTPPEWNCLDGHRFRDDDGSEYFIYSHEWVDFPSGNGEFWIQPLAEDFTSLVGEKTYLFRGRDAAWSGGVTDGPSMLKHGGKYYLFWSTGRGDYRCGYASADGVLGPYTQSLNPTIADDGGHSTWFRRDGTGDLLVTYHQPNGGGQEHARIDRLCFSAGVWLLCKYAGLSLDAWPSYLPLAFFCFASVVVASRHLANPRGRGRELNERREEG
ncbi:MAG: family 43 glycosylhydrolase [Candidatus Lokiarchaeota archaeon]|nr:family 43 glycosylhydrolase [Candidatus Lokiarchaeota archaeon]